MYNVVNCVLLGALADRERDYTQMERVAHCPNMSTLRHEILFGLNILVKIIYVSKCAVKERVSFVMVQPTCVLPFNMRNE